MGTVPESPDPAPVEAPSARDAARPPATPPKPPPDMAILMLELARIRRDVEGQSEAGRRAGLRTWLLLAAVVAALAWSVFGGPCAPRGGVP